MVSEVFFYGCHLVIEMDQIWDFFLLSLQWKEIHYLLHLTKSCHSSNPESDTINHTHTLPKNNTICFFYKGLKIHGKYTMCTNKKCVKLKKIQEKEKIFMFLEWNGVPFSVLSFRFWCGNMLLDSIDSCFFPFPAQSLYSFHIPWEFLNKNWEKSDSFGPQNSFIPF